MKKYNIYAKVVGGKYIGEVEANSEKEAIDKGWAHENCFVSLCHRCSEECDGGEVAELTAEPVGD